MEKLAHDLGMFIISCIGVFVILWVMVYALQIAVLIGLIGFPLFLIVQGIYYLFTGKLIGE